MCKMCVVRLFIVYCDVIGMYYISVCQCILKESVQSVSSVLKFRSVCGISSVYVSHEL